MLAYMDLESNSSRFQLEELSDVCHSVRRLAVQAGCKRVGSYLK